MARARQTLCAMAARTVRYVQLSSELDTIQIEEDNMSISQYPNRLVASAAGAILPPVVLLAINFARWWRFYHPQTSFDFGARIGFPFAFWQSEQFVGGDQILWPGLLADLALCLLIGFLGYLITDRVYTWAADRQ